MSTATVETTATLPGEAVPESQPFDVTADIFYGMIEAGLIPRDKSDYLQDGKLYERMAKTKAYSAIAAAFGAALYRRLPGGWSVWSEGQISLDAKNSPLPDVAVVCGGDPLVFAREDRYPEPRDLGLIVEIALTSLPNDLGKKREDYARAKIPAYWVADIAGRRVFAHSEPRVVDGRAEYATIEVVGPGTSLNLVLDGAKIAQIPYEAVMC